MNIFRKAAGSSGAPATLRLGNKIVVHAAIVVMLVATAFGSALEVSGWTNGVESSLRTFRNTLNPKQASGELVVVEIDARSIAELSDWPWPRRLHGQLVDRLNELGARRIGFDIDFSSDAAVPENDRLFAEALARSRVPVTLPSFIQRENRNSDTTIESVPIPALARHVELSTVSVVASLDGTIPRIPLGVDIAGALRPSLAAATIGQSRAEPGSAPIDYSIDPRSFPSVSYADVIKGRVDPEMIRGRNVMIGGTAIELGDKYPAPGHGVIPGVYIQAIAAETFHNGRPIELGGEPLLGIVIVMLGLAVLQRRTWLKAALVVTAGIAPVAAATILEATTPKLLDIVPAMGAFGVAMATLMLIGLTRSICGRITTSDRTGLPNLNALRLAGLKEGYGTVVARIHNFSEINAALSASDRPEFIRRVAQRFQLTTDGATIHQIDERSFAWTTQQVDDDLTAALDGLQMLFNAGVTVNGRTVDVVATVGICLEEVGDIDAAVAGAALAADIAHRQGKVWERYMAGSEDEVQWRTSLLGELDRSIDDGQVWVAYQPKYEISTQRIIGAEALVRWNHPERGAIRPDQFIPLAEENGRIEKLTLFVLERSIRDIAGVDEEMSISVNISPRMLGIGRLAKPIRRMLETHGVEPARLILEITEASMMERMERAIDEMNELRALGVRISVDDYGTGQSTLNYLKSLPATELKIDQSFVRNLTHSKSDQIVVSSTINLGHELGMKVVAEGVEADKCLEALEAMGCDLVQGYLIGRPMEFDAFAQIVERNREERKVA